MARAARKGRIGTAAAIATVAFALGTATATATDPEYATVPTTFDATPWSECTQYLRAGAAPLAACDDDAVSRPIGRVDDGAILTGRLLLNFQTLTFVQDSPIQEAELRLHVVSRGSIAPARLLVHRVTSYWTAGSDTAAQITVDPEPLAALTPSADGTVSLDVTWLADAWRRWRVTSGRDGLWNTGLLVRLEHEPLTGGCQAPLCPQAQIAGMRHPVPALRPVVRSLSWRSARNDATVRATLLDGDVRRIGLSTSSPSLAVGAARFQYLAGERAGWRDVPLSALSDGDGTPLAAESIPFAGSPGWRWAGAVWDPIATLGAYAGGVVRIRAIQYAGSGYDGGVTEETSFRLPEPDPRPNAPGPSSPGGSRAPGGEDPAPVGTPPSEPSPLPPLPVTDPPAGPVSVAPLPAPTGVAARRPAQRRAGRAAARAGRRAPRTSGTPKAKAKPKAQARKRPVRRAAVRCAKKPAARRGASGVKLPVSKRGAKAQPRPRGCRR